MALDLHIAGAEADARREAEIRQSPLAIRGMTVSYDQKPAIFSVDATIRPGRMTAIIGPNGAGKSTLLKAALGLVKPLSGAATVYGVPLAQMRHRIAYVPQRASVDWDFPTRVKDVVGMGLYRQLGLVGRFTGAHKARIAECLARVGMEDFADRQIGQLSGGQQQRVFLARSLAQDADLYLLDEPFAGVDAATERAIIDVLKELKAEGRTVVAVHHDLSTVREYFDDVLMLNVRKVAEGPVSEAFNTASLEAAYGGRLATAQIDRLAEAG
ncbi:MAG: metal ABC transporter ATP-binding protein [Silicimonas sp.]|nr:metal ABC transporter ATP-binding protein [Silicimonas sp.]NNF92931.1 metal ABC transporter ATP-binding protein [Boseongicola sp.]RZW10724.1 MAG: metal ABC transporter ATP-binding protein [Paracoccaceae bacterium]NND21175.1 metal ABC transporter ATP-binding protein [Silicimonas sp.]NND41233.1 metal ABC transporter ATP-binding protein [Silicimonas sp.]